MFKDRIILALDVDDFRKAKYFLDRLSPYIKTFKIGSQLFTACGPRIVRYVLKKKRNVFLDLKFFDIPNTVSNAVKSAVRLKVKMLTLHIHGGEKMLKEAVLAAKQEARRMKIRPPLLIGVTVLTSQDAAGEEVLRLAKIGLSAGLDGIVCSAREAAFLKRKIKKRFLVITPGIRSSYAVSDDQKRTATAKEAFACGADYIVVGRPVLEATNPKKALEELW
ncbi:MAG: orotidine-5'-phosphate decarboxylase [Candidatus Omnitrophica bacterium]|nr:orotidine-5'-phosphate decarboxylase [Candidatus Omnitrophota bacterium]